MADLRQVVTSLGHTDVATYIQSGNVVFTSKEADTNSLAAALERAIAEAICARRTASGAANYTAAMKPGTLQTSASPSPPTAKQIHLANQGDEHVWELVA